MGKQRIIDPLNAFIQQARSSRFSLISWLVKDTSIEPDHSSLASSDTFHRLYDPNARANVRESQLLERQGVSGAINRRLQTDEARLLNGRSRNVSRHNRYQDPRRERSQRSARPVKRRATGYRRCPRVDPDRLSSSGDLRVTKPQFACH